MGKEHAGKNIAHGKGGASSRSIGPHGATSKIKVSHILVATFKQAEEIIKDLQKGAKFEDLAKKHSTDTTCKAQGGLLGTIEKQNVSEEFWDAATSLRINEVSDPIQDHKGFHVIKRML
nr:peptidylprolyl isomerase [Candidatus Sigynarchaeota archaeon]